MDCGKRTSFRRGGLENATLCYTLLDAQRKTLTPSLGSRVVGHKLCDRLQFWAETPSATLQIQLFLVHFDRDALGPPESAQDLFRRRHEGSEGAFVCRPAGWRRQGNAAMINDDWSPPMPEKLGTGRLALWRRAGRRVVDFLPDVVWFVSAVFAVPLRGLGGGFVALGAAGYR